jgi:hypothetical protein
MTETDPGELFDGLPHQAAPESKSPAAARLRTAERRQVALRVVCLDELVPHDHRKRYSDSTYQFFERSLAFRTGLGWSGCRFEK